ncbi:predicted protein [Aspergillus nidulans FGSC A4]|uniref:Uncharacterized protein n=1 Tax=Emericella nidulans (strain FGSC A4 / ATCC 38163 / CBS 112.46 / NRRL 194 / M139) TaxID=227321 RepID=Q5B2S0_EMENI|nr:hypothetical protein [Aspergillus nidulans FGSC A4]EAA62341.1 predicted protein [Aspergillus nidulans FGSC A4]CBF80988.1 TPA: conserved hypothetical protein [Aspergillus nidulans FGSC A4]|eukprot:XP_662764.1 predicted protein [Aspergillus nidulans FGSC A4]
MKLAAALAVVFLFGTAHAIPNSPAPAQELEQQRVRFLVPDNRAAEWPFGQWIWCRRAGSVFAVLEAGYGSASRGTYPESTVQAEYRLLCRDKHSAVCPAPTSLPYPLQVSMIMISSVSHCPALRWDLCSSPCSRKEDSPCEISESAIMSLPVQGAICFVFKARLARRVFLSYYFGWNRQLYYAAARLSAAVMAPFLVL